MEGLDVSARLISGRAEGLARAIEDNPGGSREVAVHLCQTEECVQHAHRSLSPHPIHVVAISVLHRGQLSETWYREGVTAWDEIIEKDDRYPEMLTGPASRGTEASKDSAGPALAALVGGASTHERWAGSTLGLEPPKGEKLPQATFSPQPPARSTGGERGGGGPRQSRSGRVPAPGGNGGGICARGGA